MDQEKIGKFIYDLRKKYNLTQAELANRLCVTAQAVSKWENGSSDPNTSNLIALAKLYKISPEELLRCVETTPEVNDDKDII